MNDDIVAGFDDGKDDSLKVRLQKIEDVCGCLVLSLTGSIDTYNAAAFHKRVDRAVDAGYTRLVFILDGLSYLSSSGIGAFTHLLRTVKARGGDLVLLGIRPQVYEVFRLLGFSQYFTIEENLDEAIASFSRGGAGGAGAVFPRTFACPICSRRLKAAKAGRFRCPECRTILVLDEAGAVGLG